MTLVFESDLIGNTMEIGRKKRNLVKGICSNVVAKIRYNKIR